MKRLVAFLLLLALSNAIDGKEEGNDAKCKFKTALKPRPHSVSILEFGAVGDGKTANTLAFQNAIFYLQSFADKGGAQLYVPPGKWLTGNFNLISHLTLFLEKGAVILASQEPSQFDLIEPLPSYGRGVELPGKRYRSLINGNNLTDVVITGDNGTIDGQGSGKMSLPILLGFLLLLSPLPLLAAADSDSDRVTDLLHLQSQSKSGVIHLNDQSLSRFLSSPRSYSLFIFFDALQLHDKQELRLKDLHYEFNLVAASFLAHNQHTPSQSKLFFCDLEFKESQQSFHLFGVNALPHIRHVGPQIQNLRDSDPMDQGDFARLAESMAEFVESKTKLTVGPIQRPPIVSNTQIGFIVAALLAAAPFVIKRVLSGETLIHEPMLWLSLSVFVYFFSVSGAMHNIIRKMPMFLTDREDPNKLVFFYQGSGMQLGAEGFAVGFLYTVVGLLLAFASHILVYVRSKNVQRGFMVFMLLISFWAVKKVVYLDNWKTGYAIHGYWPSSWK